MAIYNGGNNDTTDATALGGSDTEDDDRGFNLLPEEPGTIGFNGTLPSDLNITTTYSNTSTTATATATDNATDFGDDTFSTSGAPSGAPSSSSPSFIDSLGTRTTMERGGDHDNSEIGNTLGEFFIDDRLLTVVQTQPLRQGQPTMPSTTAATAAASAEKVSFPICPNTVLSFEGDSSPIILETQPARNNLIEIFCIVAPGQGRTTTTSSSSGTRSCVMSGGNVHMLIKYIPGYNTMMMPEEDGMTSNTTAPSTAGPTTESTALDGEANDHNNSNSITISGITFRDASQTSVLMNDPRGKIYFKDCAWENNSGETTVLINGRYNSTSSSLLGSQEGEEVGVESGLDLSISTTSSTVNFANFVLTTTATSFTTTTPMLDADATVSPFQIANDDDQMMLATIIPPKKEENSRRQLFLIDDEDEGKDTIVTSRQTEDEHMLHRTRLLVADDTPLSSISIDNCVFSVSNVLACAIPLHCDLLCLTETAPLAYSRLNNFAGEQGQFHHRRLVQF